MKAQGKYGVDAPGPVMILAGAAAAELPIGLWLMLGMSNGLLHLLGAVLVATAVFVGTEAALMLYSSLVGKPKLWNRLLDDLKLTGRENVLDIGPGRGQQLTAVARRLHDGGRAVGLDLWEGKDQSNNTRAAAEANMRAEGVDDRVELVKGDMRELPFTDGSFDLIISCLAVHNIPNSDGRTAAIREMTRVLTPGGRMLLIDFKHTAEYTRTLSTCREIKAVRSGRKLAMFPPVRLIRVSKG